MKVSGAPVVARLEVVAPEAKAPIEKASLQVPFGPTPTVFTDGPRKGELVDKTVKRSVQIVENKPDGSLAVANVYHQGQFHVARFTAGSVKDVRLQVEHFPAPVPAAHTQLRFTFDPPALLVPQDAPDKPPLPLHDLVFSIEAAGAKGEAYSLLKGMLGYFKTAYRMVSLDETVKTSGDHKIDQHRLKLDDALKQDLLRWCTYTANAVGEEDDYNTLGYSCTTELFDTLDEVLRQHDKLPLTAKLGTRIYPPLAAYYLKLRGVLDETSLPTLAEELAQL